LSFSWKKILGYPGQGYPIKSHHTSGFYPPENHLASSLLLPLLTLFTLDMTTGGDDVREIDRKNKKQSSDFDGIVLCHPDIGGSHLVIHWIKGFPVVLCFIFTLPPGSYIHDARNEILFPWEKQSPKAKTD
jgi:hypothetical protein